MSESPKSGRKLRRNKRGTSLLAHGENMVWLTGGSLAICIVMILGLLALIVYQGGGTFWPRPLVRVETDNGPVLGEITREERVNLGDPGDDEVRRRLFRIGNFDITGKHFEWISDSAIRAEQRPEWAIVVERRSWGRFYGSPAGFLIDGNTVADTPDEIWTYFEQYHTDISDRFDRRYKLQRVEFGLVHARVEGARLELKKVEMQHGLDSGEYKTAHEVFEDNLAGIEHRKKELTEDIALLDHENERYVMVMETADGGKSNVALVDVVRAYPANRLSTGDKIGVYLSRWWEFLTADPREANSEGGVWPAIVGTVIMTLLMSIAVVPFGVLAALYLREYAKAGPLVSAVRIAVNNLAGVPSIVFGVFGLGFFCYVMGASLDELLFAAKLPNPTYGKGGVLWAAFTLALLTLPVVVVATEEALAAVPGSMREGSYACGASKWQTIRRIVLPRAMPGIMTGFILAMARGAGEVAPLMLVGAVKLAPDLPLDAIFPYLHPERSFMHLGFHIYDVGFQSQNSEAAKPMVYTTTLLLISLIAVLNLASVWVRTRLRRKFVGSKF
jgi:phosphate transport system permease protein